MKIAFWGEEDSCGTTMNMLAMASYLTTRSTYRSVLISACNGSKNIKKHFSNTSIERGYVRESCDYYVLEGIDYLLATKKKQMLTKKHIHDSMQNVMDGKLFCISSGEHILQNYYPEELEQVLSMAIHLADGIVDYTFIDCGCKKDIWTKKMLQEADIVVVNFKQSPRALDDFFLNHVNISDKICYFVGSYQKESIYNKQNLQRMYRIEPEKIGVIPYSAEFQLACQRGQLDKFMKGKGKLYQSENKRYFFQELENTMQLLLEYQKDGDE